MVDDQQTHNLPSNADAMTPHRGFLDIPTRRTSSPTWSPVYRPCRTSAVCLQNRRPCQGREAWSLLARSTIGDSGDARRSGFVMPAASRRQSGAGTMGATAHPQQRAREILTELTPGLLWRHSRYAGAGHAPSPLRRLLGANPGRGHACCRCSSEPSPVALVGAINGMARRWPTACPHPGPVRRAARGRFLCGRCRIRDSPGIWTDVLAAHTAMRTLWRGCAVGWPPEIPGRRPYIWKGCPTAWKAGRFLAGAARLPVAAAALSRRNSPETGRVPGGRFAILALGRLGGR